jgi:hypothetical protein
MQFSKRLPTRIIRSSLLAAGLTLAFGTQHQVIAQDKVDKAESAKSDPIATDRPDFVESAQVVGRGRFQLETGYTLDKSKHDGIKNDSYSTPTLLRFGLNDSWEFRVETEGFMRSTSQNLIGPGAGTSLTEHGFADLGLGLKWQLQNGDEATEKPSIGIVGQLDFSSGSQAFRGQGTRPSLLLAVEWDLPGDTAIGFMPGIIVDKNDQGKNFGIGVLALTMSKPIAQGWSGFVEVAAQELKTRKNGGNVVTFDTGISYLLSNDAQVDFYVMKGISKAASNLQTGVGLSLRY